MTEIDADTTQALISAQSTVNGLRYALDDAQDRRAVAFALANEKGISSGAIARATGVTPNQVLSVIKVGRYILAQRRARRQRHLEAV